MKRIYLILSVLAGTFLVGGAVLLTQNINPSEGAASSEIALFEHPDIMKPNYEEKEKSIKPWEEFARLARANQETGELNLADVIEARKEVAALISRNRSSRNLSLQWMFMGPDNFGGRSRDILFDKDNPERVYTGGVSGGLWYSNNEGESWMPYDKDDTLAGIGVVSIAQTTSGDIYVGTGENWPGSGAPFGTSAGGFLGFGVWKSTDGGNNFTHLASTTPAARNNPGAEWAYVPSLAVHPSDGNTVLAGTNDGLKITKDGGQTWTDASTNFQLNNGNVQDLAITANGTVHAIATNGGSALYFRGNIDDAASYQNRTSAVPTKPYSRLALAVAPSDENYVYMVGCNGAGNTVGVYQSTDGGDSWNSIAPLTLPSNGFNPTGNQGNYDMEIAVHPENKEKVFVAGQLSLYTYGEANGQMGWWAISNWGTRLLNPSFDPQYVHADHHRIVFHPTKPDWMFIATDGGIFRTKQASADYPSLPSFSRMNKFYGVAQLHDMSVGYDGKIYCGTQDNGTMAIDFAQNNPKAAEGIGGGDGFAVEVSKTNPNAVFYAIQDGNLRRSSNAGSTFASFFDRNIDCLPRNANNNCSGDGEPDCGVQQRSVIRLWENLDTASADYGEGRLFFGTYCGVWVAIDALDFGSNAVWFNIANAGTGISAGNQNYSSMNFSEDGDILYVGTSAGELYRIDGLGTAVFEYDDNGTPTPDDDTFNPTAAGLTTTRIGNWPNRFITEIAVDQNNPEHVVVTLGNYGNQNYVYKSNNAASTTGTSSFTTIQGNLPRMPVYSAVIDYYDGNNIILGTEMGVFSSTNGGNIWQPDVDGMPYVAVLNLDQELIKKEGCYSLYAGTYGRGVYQSGTLTPSNCQIVTGIENPVFVNNDFGLYPNPANAFTQLSFSLDKASEVGMNIYSITGRRVMNRNLGHLYEGGHVVPVNTGDLSTGYYLVVLTNKEGERMTQKMVVSR